MKTIADYIEELKEKYKLESYYKTMAYINMQPQGWTKIKAGGGISEKNALRLAQALKIDPIEIMAVSNALKAENNEVKMVWLRLAKEKETERKKANTHNETIT
jgi:copper homeostasis protein CutC